MCPTHYATLWHDKLVLWMPDREHRAGCFAHDLLGDAAHEHMRDRPATMSAHDDQVDFPLLGVPHDFQERCTKLRHNLSVISLTVCGTQHFFQLLTGSFT